MEQPHWIVLGPKESWQAAFKLGGIWGVKAMLYPEWKALDQGDRIFLFVTKPVSGVIGAGRVQAKFIQDKPLWPDEIAVGSVIYPYRFEFSVDYVLEQERWQNDRLKVSLTIQEMRRGINLLLKRTVDQLYDGFREQFQHPISQAEEAKGELGTIAVTEDISPTHAQVQQTVFEVGKLNRLICEKEYPMDGERLDVVWRRVERSVPTYVFEIQIAGDIYHALAKLKHAYDLWNSNLFLIANADDLDKAKLLLSGTFHEIQQRVKTITPQKIQELYRQKKRWVEIEREIGLL